MVEEDDQDTNSIDDGGQSMREMMEMMKCMMLEQLRLYTRLDNLESEVSQLKNKKLEQPRIQINTTSDDDVKKGDDVSFPSIISEPLFKAGENNPKGGLYSYTYRERVFVKDERKLAVAWDETNFYCWVKVDGEKYSSTSKGRRMLKSNIRKVQN